MSLQHACDGAPDYEGGEWIMARCTCGWSCDGFPDVETAIDELMSHAMSAAIDWSRGVGT